MSRYRKSLTEAYKEVLIKEQNKDHEISMARGELEAISDKALKLSSMLQGKTDEGNPLEAWVQSKITKAKDYINSVSDYMEYTPEQTNEEVNETPQGYALVQKAKEIAKKFANNYTKAVDEIEKLEKGLSKNSTVEKELLKYNESLEEADNYPTKDMNDKKHSAYNDPKKGEKKVVDPEPKISQTGIEETSLKAIFTANQEGQKIDDIAKKLKMSVSDVKKILGEETINEFKKMTVTFKTHDQMSKASTDLAKQGFTIDAKGLVMKVDGKGDDLNKYATDMKNFYGASVKAESYVNENFNASQIARLKKEYEVLRGKKISIDNANKLSKMFKNIPDSGLVDLYKADIPFLSTMAMTKMIQKNIPRPAGVKLNLGEKKLTVKKVIKLERLTILNGEHTVKWDIN